MLLLESNHDLEMLKVGPYPWSVKQRVMGRNGHLSNDAHLRFIWKPISTRGRADADSGASERAQQSSGDRAHGRRAVARRRAASAPRLVIAEQKRQTEVIYVLIPRYTRPEMGAIWSDQNNRFQQWLEVELAAIGDAGRDRGWSPPKPPCPARRHARFDVARIYEIEREVKHDVIAFTTAVAESMAAAGHAEASRWFHYGLTSNDVVDTAQALQLGQASRILLRRDREGCAKCSSAAPSNSSTPCRSAARMASTPSRSRSA